MKIKGHNLKYETVKELGKFAVLWNLFEKDFCGKSCNPQKIIKICDSGFVTIDRDVMQELAIVVAKRWAERYYIFDWSDYVKDSLYPDDSKQNDKTEIYKSKMQKFLEEPFPEIIDSEIYIGCLLVIERIRNNLMHGLKEIELLDDQLPLFRAVNAVLENIRNPMLQDTIN